MVKPRSQTRTPSNMADEANQNEQEDAGITTLLKSIKLDCYSKNFVEKGYECMEQLETMTPTEVQQLIIDAEIMLGGHQQRLKSAIRTLQSSSSNPPTKPPEINASLLKEPQVAEASYEKLTPSELRKMCKFYICRA